MPSNKMKLVYKILLIALALIAFGTTIFVIVCMLGSFNNYFLAHFAVPLVLLSVGFIAFILPEATKTRFGGDAKDSIIKVLAIILILAAILTLVLSYLNFFR